jgi:hypothetical protein
MVVKCSHVRHSGYTDDVHNSGIQLRLDIGVKQVIYHHFRADLNNCDRHCILLFSTTSPLHN